MLQLRPSSEPAVSVSGEVFDFERYSGKAGEKSKSGSVYGKDWSLMTVQVKTEAGDLINITCDGREPDPEIGAQVTEQCRVSANGRFLNFVKVRPRAPRGEPAAQG